MQGGGSIQHQPFDDSGSDVYLNCDVGLAEMDCDTLEDLLVIIGCDVSEHAFED